MFKPSKFQIAILIGILTVILVAWVDIQGTNLIGYEDYTNGNFNSSVWIHHLITSIIIFLIPALCYFFFYRKDFSESIAIFGAGWIMFYFGLADIFYFWLQGKAVPILLTHLNTHPVIGLISSKLGFANVTNIALYISVLIGFIVVFIKSKILKKYF